MSQPGPLAGAMLCHSSAPQMHRQWDKANAKSQKPHSGPCPPVTTAPLDEGVHSPPCSMLAAAAVPQDPTSIKLSLCPGPTYHCWAFSALPAAAALGRSRAPCRLLYIPFRPLILLRHTNMLLL